MERRLAVVGILIEDPEQSAQKVNDILHNHSEIIVGRMGIPYKERGISAIALIVDGTTDQIGAMTGKIGNISGVKVKSAVTG